MSVLTEGLNELDAKRAHREAIRVDDANSRSWQLVNALRTDLFDAAHLGRADQIILDLEDAVDDALKDQARSNVIEWLRGGGRAWVRINDITTPSWEDDVRELAGTPGLAGVMLAKVEAAEQVTDTFQRLGGRTPVIALLESALGIEDAVSIARARGVFRLAFGSGDYRKDTGAENNALAMSYPRTRLVLASRIGNLPAPIDGPTVTTQHATLREGAADAVAMGMTGKLCLNLDAPAVINESMAPTPADVAWAIEFLRKFEEDGRVIRDGSDKPRLARASKIVERGEIYRIQPATAAGEGFTY
ncbi:HpcH/HpaI aldolase/citrate lyase family protein [Nocardioides sp. Kera G14]|uniref:HpcH/HpaI aldolase/citrate lyase family protein n=1 Tax=Nocardioides sp. Kera G14 TaxID=2884264 RepID=UPI001D12CBBB|nr:CoA ester lyase [Nocardioides sp. Kera G14]UDY23420.1 CoA ester lyase [Nocardioides sp. Kera G14]